MSIMVSFPRSGQHLVERILSYCCEQHDVEFTYCEFYTCCESLPCKEGKQISKNHDFNLRLEIENNTKYVSLYRKDIIIQLEAYYRYWIKYNDEKYEYKNLLSFIKDKTPYYNEFVNKWINNKNKNILKVEYYEILDNPEKISKKIFKHFFPDVKIKNSVFRNLVNIELETPMIAPHKDQNVRNPEMNGVIRHKIGLINKLDDKIYKKLKKDLGYENLHNN
jgi:hypothetical protein